MRYQTYLLTILVLALVSLAIVWKVGAALSAPANHAIGPAPAGLGAATVVFGNVQGWFVSVPSSPKCVLLLHPLRSDRTGMVERARFLKRAGYSSLLIDLQAHGETLGESISFGYRESASARSALDFLRSSGHCGKIAVIGVSLGGAASLLGAEPLGVDAYVLEAVYPSIEDAIMDRLDLHLGFLGKLAAPLLVRQIPLRLQIPINALRPVDAIQRVKAPVLIVAGSEDRHTPLPESRRLYDNAPEPKEWWVVQGAGHEDFHRFAAARYEERISAFLSKHLDP